MTAKVKALETPMPDVFFQSLTGGNALLTEGGTALEIKFNGGRTEKYLLPLAVLAKSQSLRPGEHVDSGQLRVTKGHAVQRPNNAADPFNTQVQIAFYKGPPHNSPSTSKVVVLSEQEVLKFLHAAGAAATLDTFDGRSPVSPHLEVILDPS